MNLQIKKVIASSLVFASFVPMVALAENTTPITSTNAQPVVATMAIPQAGKNFCANLTKVSQKLSDQVANKETDVVKKESDRQSNMAHKQANADEKLASNRIKADGVRAQKEANLKTDAGKAYAASVEAAVTARKTAVDAAIATYRAGLTQAVSSNKALIDASMASFKSAIDAAIAKATTDCVNKVDNATVGKAFNQNIKDARAALAIAKKSLPVNASALQALKKTRDDAIAKAMADFKLAITAAQTAMKATKAQLKADKNAAKIETGVKQ